jgi:hypothetical protein
MEIDNYDYMWLSYTNTSSIKPVYSFMDKDTLKLFQRYNLLFTRQVTRKKMKVPIWSCSEKFLDNYIFYTSIFYDINRMKGMMMIMF